MALVERDIHTTLPDRPAIEVRVAQEGEGEGLIIEFREGDSGGWSTGWGLGSTPAGALAAIASYLQDFITDNWRVWPVCAEHDRGLHATVVGDAAVWQCSAGLHTTARIGHLGA